MFRINWPQLQLIRSPKLEPCSLGSVNVITGDSGASGGSCCTSSGRKNMHLHKHTKHHHCWNKELALPLSFFVIIIRTQIHSAYVLFDSTHTIGFIPKAISFWMVCPPASSIFMSLQYSFPGLNWKFCYRLWLAQTPVMSNDITGVWRARAAEGCICQPVLQLFSRRLSRNLP